MVHMYKQLPEDEQAAVGEVLDWTSGFLVLLQPYADEQDSTPRWKNLQRVQDDLKRDISHMTRNLVPSLRLAQVSRIASSEVGFR